MSPNEADIQLQRLHTVQLQERLCATPMSAFHVVVQWTSTTHAQSRLTPCDPTDYSPPGSSVHQDSPGKNTGVGCMPSSGDLPNLGIKLGSPALQADSLPTELSGKPLMLLQMTLFHSFPG